MQNSGKIMPRECRSVPRNAVIASQRVARMRAPLARNDGDDGSCLRIHSVLLNNPINVALASVLKCKLKPTTAAEVSASTCSFSCDTAKIVKT